MNDLLETNCPTDDRTTTFTFGSNPYQQLSVPAIWVNQIQLFLRIDYCLVALLLINLNGAYYL